jgi:serine protease inhibitor
MNHEPNGNTTGDASSAFALACNETGIKLMLELARADAGGNVLVSPVSLALALALLYHGAGGRTRAALEESLGLAGLAPEEVGSGGRALLDALAPRRGEGVSVAVANAVWTDLRAPLDAGFARTVRDSYDADARPVDFRDAPAASSLINSWAGEKTGGKIDALLEASAITSATDCVITSAAYFKGEWRRPFDKSLTRAGAFRLADGSAREVPIMSQTARFGTVRKQEFQAARLPYADTDFATYVFLPAPEHTLEEFLKTVSARALAAWASEMEDALLELSLPRFSQSYGAGLQEALNALNLGLLFTLEADFGPMGLGGHYVEQFKHEARAEVAEEGTAAAAATAVVMSRSAQPPSSMRVDRPFFWTIRHEPTGALLFAGCLRRPHQ